MKFEGIAKVGDTIRAYDFEPIPLRKEYFVDGVVIDANNTKNGYAAYKIVCTRDSMYDTNSAHSRVGTVIYVPFEMALLDYNGRVSVIVDRN